MNNSRRSRAFDPTYRATKTFQQIWEEAGKPDNGLKVMAEREQALHSESSEDPTESSFPSTSPTNP